MFPQKKKSLHLWRKFAIKKMKPNYSPHKRGNGATPFRGYTVTYIKNFLTGLSLRLFFLFFYIHIKKSKVQNNIRVAKPTKRRDVPSREVM